MSRSTSIVVKAPLPEGGIGLLVSTIATAISGAVGLLLVKRASCAARSAVADGKHLLTDVWTTVGVLVGVSCALIFRLPLLDAMIGLAVGAYIGYEALHLLHKAVQGLLDRSLNEEELVKLGKCSKPPSIGGAYRAVGDARGGPNPFYPLQPVG